MDLSSARLELTAAQIHLPAVWLKEKGVCPSEHYREHSRQSQGSLGSLGPWATRLGSLDFSAAVDCHVQVCTEVSLLS